MADIFISYTSTDRDWAFWIANELRAIGHTAHVHEWEVKGGDDIYAWMEQRHDAADHVLCVLSDEYMKAPYSTLERHAALWQAASKRPGFVLLVGVKPCRLPTLSDHIRRCELFGIPEDAARIRFRDFMTKRDAPATVSFPGKVFAVSNIAIRVPTHFLGREDEFAMIDAALGRDQRRVAITALHGLRGVGKSTLAAAYAERHRGDYRAMWWIRSQTEPGLRADLVALGVRLGWVAEDDEEEPALSAVMERLLHEGDGILLIFDNAGDAAALKRYLPRGGAAQVLVTSIAHAWRGVAELVEIRVWPKEIGADYLIARTGRPGERDAALALSDALGGLPLAHEQAAAYIERLDVTLAEYRRRFDAAPVRLLDDTHHAPAEYYDGRTVAKTFALAIEGAANLYPAAEPLMFHAALLAPEPIPLFIFAEACEKFGEPLASAVEGDGLDEAVAALRTFALVDRGVIQDEREPSITTDTIRLHRLVREVAAALRKGSAQENVRRALIEALAAVYPQQVYNDPQTWPRARRLDALVVSLVRRDVAPLDGTEAHVWHLLTCLAAYRERALGAYAQARPLYERALAICELDLSAEDPIIATSLNNLAVLLNQEGNYVRAIPLYERALAMDEKLFGRDHPKVATALGNLASALDAHGDYAQARLFAERSLAIRERALGDEHPDTATSLNNLSGILMHLGDLAGARALCERGLMIREKVLGLEHTETALSLHNLASMLHAQGDTRASRHLFERALVIREKVLGDAHPHTNYTRRDLAGLLLELGNATEGLSLAEPALAAHDKALGPKHPWTRGTARVTADALDALGRTEEAKALRERYRLTAPEEPKTP